MTNNTEETTLLEITENLPDDTRATVLAGATYQAQPHVRGGHRTWLEDLVTAGQVYQVLCDMAFDNQPIPHIPLEYRTPELARLLSDLFGVRALNAAWEYTGCPEKRLNRDNREREERIRRAKEAAKRKKA